MSFAALGSTHDRDLASIVQLQMARQLTMPLQGASIDHVRLDLQDTQTSPKDEKEPHAQGGSRQTEVLAAALPGEHVTWCRTIAKAAKLRLKSVALRSEGSAALFSQLSYTQDGPVLGISVTPAGVELGVIAQGRVVFSRAVDLTLPEGTEDWTTFTSRIAIEAKRTRVGYRNSGDHQDIACLGVLGDDALAGTVGKVVGEALELPWHAVRFPGAVDIPSDMDTTARSSLAPLIGIMLGAAIDRQTYDFSNPRKAPDTAAPIRQAALAAALGIIVFGGGGWVVADQRLSALKDKVQSAQDDLSSIRISYVKRLRAEARLSHLDNLSKIGVDWVGHLEYLSQVMPARDQARLESLDGTLVSAVEIHSRANPQARRISSLYDAQWSYTQYARFNLSGRVDSRTVANDFRGRLVQNAQYVIKSLGADEPTRFDYVISTTAVSPTDETEADSAAQSTNTDSTESKDLPYSKRKTESESDSKGARAPDEKPPTESPANAPTKSPSTDDSKSKDAAGVKGSEGGGL